MLAGPRSTRADGRSDSHAHSDLPDRELGATYACTQHAPCVAIAAERAHLKKAAGILQVSYRVSRAVAMLLSLTRVRSKTRVCILKACF